MPGERALSKGPGRTNRSVQARAFLSDAMRQHTELVGRDVVETLGDGMRVQAILMELQLGERAVEWAAAAALLFYHSANINTWSGFVDDEYMEQRVLNLKRNGLLRDIERCNLSSADF